MKVKLRIERLTVHREKYLQLRNEIVALIVEDMIEEGLRRWGDLLRVWIKLSMLLMNTSKRIAKWKIISLQKKIHILKVVNLQVLN